jgi:phosphoenolpyruvate synthase/pyruvate phosphate dikinase
VERPPESGIEWLGATEGDLRVVGGKAASLDRLARLGFRIPPGFCVTTAAFHAQLAAIPGGAEAVAALPEEAARLRLTGAFEMAAIDPDLRVSLDGAIARLVDELAQLGVADPLFAVRSSGIGEDGTAASYAGLHETELGVAPMGIEAAIRRCWASLWSTPALAYRVRRGLPLDGGGMAVVVQSLVPADASAVVFTRHPVTRTDDIVITAVRGLGESMVAGTVTPDTLVLDRRTLEVVEYAPGDRGSRLVASGNGGVVEVPDELADAALDGTLLTDLAELALRVEGGFGAPVDIEAAAAGGRWFLLQARPITTG